MRLSEIEQTDVVLSEIIGNFVNWIEMIITSESVNAHKTRHLSEL